VDPEGGLFDRSNQRRLIIPTKDTPVAQSNPFGQGAIRQWSVARRLALCFPFVADKLRPGPRQKRKDKGTIFHSRSKNRTIVSVFVWVETYPPRSPPCAGTASQYLCRKDSSFTDRSIFLLFELLVMIAFLPLCITMYELFENFDLHCSDCMDWVKAQIPITQHQVIRLFDSILFSSFFTSILLTCGTLAPTSKQHTCVSFALQLVLFDWKSVICLTCSTQNPNRSRCAC